jgi:hypothetical protein
MLTIYDVFAQIIEKSPCKISDLHFASPIYAHITTLKKKNWVKKSGPNLIPLRTDETISAFNIIKYCLKNGLDYNLFFSKNISKVILEISRHSPTIRPKSLQNNKEHTELMKYLERNQFILLTKKRPKEGILLSHQLLHYVLQYNMVTSKLVTNSYIDVLEEVLCLKSHDINPFDDEVFSFLSGSAQLEGSTITVGETRELLVHDIYPEKPKKDIQMVQNLNEALYILIKHLHEDITPDLIKEMNRAVLFSLHRNAGNYKKINNKIQGNPLFKTAHPNQVSELMNLYCEKIKQFTDKKTVLENIGYIHNELQFIHPFSDGNSRTTRMIVNWIILKTRLPLLVLKMGSFDEYMSLTKLSKKRDDKRLTQFFHHLLLHEYLIGKE